MKRAAVVLRRLAGDVGIEGAFLLAGTVLLSVAASYVTPAGPFVVVGLVCLIAGIFLVVPPRRA